MLSQNVNFWDSNFILKSEPVDGGRPPNAENEKDGYESRLFTSQSSDKLSIH